MNKPVFFRRPFKYSYSHITLIIAVINLVIYALCYFTPEFGKYIYNYGALNASRVEYRRMYWQFFTYMFVHHDFSHVFFNMFGLLMFGIPLEKCIGSKEFSLFYAVCGILSGLFSFLVYKFTGQYRVFLLGASGAVYAVLFAYAVVYPKSTVFIWGIVPVPAPILVIIYALIEVASQMLGRGANVAHLTHLFGFLAAILYFEIRMGIHPVKIWKNAYGK